MATNARIQIGDHLHLRRFRGATRPRGAEKSKGADPEDPDDIVPKTLLGAVTNVPDAIRVRS